MNSFPDEVSNSDAREIHPKKSSQLWESASRILVVVMEKIPAVAVICRPFTAAYAHAFILIVRRHDEKGMAVTHALRASKIDAAWRAPE